MAGERDDGDTRFTLLLPCAGNSSRFPGMRPKWMLTTPSGAMMVERSAADLPAGQVDRIVVGIRREHEEAYAATEALKRAFGDRLEVHVFERPTRGPAETVRLMIEACGVSGPICIKDADSFIGIDSLPAHSFVGAIDLRQHPDVRSVAQKSFVVLNEQNIVTDIVEKDVVSNHVSIGLYGFLDASLFLDAYRKVSLDAQAETFVSHVMSQAIADGEPILGHFVDSFTDVGTLADWARYVAPRKTLFLDVDGVVFRNQSKYFAPLWDDPVEPIAENVAVLREWQEAGAQLVFATARPEAYRDATHAALTACGLKVHALIMGCLHGQRVLVNDFAPSNPYPSARAVNVRRNSPDLPDLLAAPHGS